MAPKRKIDGSPAESLAQRLSRMSLAASAQDFSQVLHLANEALKSSPPNPQLMRDKVVALIKLDKYKDALSFLDESTTFLSAKDTALERGYCLYKLGKTDEAQKVLQQGSGRAVQHTLAQNVCIIPPVRSYPASDFGRHIERKTLKLQCEYMENWQRQNRCSITNCRT